VLMAVVTTLCMPPLLRWALARVPMLEEEKERMETEVAEEKDLLPKVKRVLVAFDASTSGAQASVLAGWFIGSRHLTATVLDVSAVAPAGADTSAQPLSVIEAAKTAERAAEASDKLRAADKETTTRDPIGSAVRAAKAERTAVKELISILPWRAPAKGTRDAAAEAILTEAKNGYDLLFLGLPSETQSGVAKFPPGLERIIREFKGSVAVFLNPADHNATPPALSLGKILVPMTGADYSRFGGEVAVAIAKGCGATITALHVAVPPTETDVLRRPKQLRRPGRALLGEIVALGQREGVRVLTKSLVRLAKEDAILHQAGVGGHQLIVIGTKAWSGEGLHFGQSAETIIVNARCPVLLLKS
jgi:nucleotide-binding universal stress UspA family protein